MNFLSGTPASQSVRRRIRVVPRSLLSIDPSKRARKLLSQALEPPGSTKKAREKGPSRDQSELREAASGQRANDPPMHRGLGGRFRSCPSSPLLSMVPSRLPLSRVHVRLQLSVTNDQSGWSDTTPSGTYCILYCADNSDDVHDGVR